MRSFALGLVLATLAVAPSGRAQSQIGDENAWIELARKMGQSAARFEVCGVDTERSLSMLKSLLEVCRASRPVRSDVTQAFIVSRAEGRDQVSGGACPWNEDHAQNNYDDTLEVVRGAVITDDHSYSCP